MLVPVIDNDSKDDSNSDSSSIVSCWQESPAVHFTTCSKADKPLSGHSDSVSLFVPSGSIQTQNVDLRVMLFWCWSRSWHQSERDRSVNEDTGMSQQDQVDKNSVWHWGKVRNRLQHVRRSKSLCSVPFWRAVTSVTDFCITVITTTGFCFYF